MADPHVILAPLVEPPLPLPQAVEAAAWPAVTLTAALVGLVLLVLLAWLWRQGTPARDLRRIARAGAAPDAARELATWQQRHWAAAPPPWRARLEQLRYGPADPEAAATLRNLCEQAAQALRAGKRR